MTRIDRVDGDDVTLLVFALRIDQLANKELLPLETRVLASRDNSAGDAGEEHNRRLLRALSDRQNVFKIRMRPRNDMHADEFTHAARSRCSGIGGCLHG